MLAGGPAQDIKAGRMSNGWSMSALPPKADIRPRDQDVRIAVAPFSNERRFIVITSIS
jgi:hypothetical protein